MRVCVVVVCVCACARMYDVYRSVSYTFEFIVVFIHGGGVGGSFRMVLCVGCLGGTVLYVCIKYHI